MSSITVRKRKDDTPRHTAQIRIMKNGQAAYQENHSRCLMCYWWQADLTAAALALGKTMNPTPAHAANAQSS